MEYKKKIKEKGIKQRWLAKKLAVSEQLFSFYLSGTRTMPDNVEKQLKEILK
jgi:predicted transcriptional regulator